MKQIVKGRWLAVKRESLAGKKREQKSRMGVLKENHMNRSMTDWPRNYEREDEMKWGEKVQKRKKDKVDGGEEGGWDERG